MTGPFVDRDHIIAMRASAPVTRFAPSPTGYLHLGHVLSMAYVFAIADIVGAKVLLRIEDHDRQRCRPDYEKAILDDIAWLGFIPHNWSSLYRQSDRTERYRDVLDRLRKENLAYSCGCSRKTIAEAMTRSPVAGEELFYPGLCRDRNLAPSEGLGTRLRVGDESEAYIDLLLGDMVQRPAQQCGDYLLQDNQHNYTYNFAVVVDDIDQGVNLIVRGQDLLHCTGRQMQLGRLLGQAAPPLFAHHPLLNDDSGKKLSKRILSEGIIKRRLAGDAAEDVLGEALWLAGVLEAPRSVKVHEVTDLLRP